MDQTSVFNAVFSRTLQLADGSIDDNLVLTSVPAWDSFSSLMVVSELERAFSVHFDVTNIAAMKTVSDFKNVLRQNGIPL
jgi:acyl carrier protein